MKLATLVLLVAVGIAFNGLGTEAVTIDQIIKALMGRYPYWKVMFVLDSSGSISTTEWAQYKLATRNILAMINNTPGRNSIAPWRHRIGLVRFSTRAQLIFPLGKYPFYPQNDAAIAAVPKGPGGMTNINMALSLCNVQLGFFGKRLVWMTTDGKYNVGGDPRPRATAMKRRGIVICVVAIGRDANMTVINAMASWIRIKTIFGYIRTKCVLRYRSYTAYRWATYYARLRLLA